MTDSKKNKNPKDSEVVLENETTNFLEEDDYELKLHSKFEEKDEEIKEIDLEEEIKDLETHDDVLDKFNELETEINEKEFDTIEIETKTGETEEIEIEPEETSKEDEKKKIKVPNTMLIVSAVFAFIYYIFYIIKALNNINYVESIINGTLLLTIFYLIVGTYFTRKKIKEMLSISVSVTVILFMCFNLMIGVNFIKLPTLALLKDYSNASLITIVNDCKKNNIKLNKVYEFSDNVKEGHVISQSVIPKTILKEVEEITVVISNGPNYDKTLMLTDFVGLKVDDLISFIEENHMINTNLNFEVNSELEKDIIASQSTKGEIKRNTEVTFNVSLGPLEGLKEIEIKDLTNKSLFEATLYLKKNGIKYEVKYEFSSKVKKDYVITQDKKAKTKVKPMEDIVVLTVSQGKEIKVPDFSGKSSDDVLSWIVSNNLKVAFEERYDVAIPKNELIGINYEAGTSISEGTKIIVITSLGPVLIPKFNSLAEFRNWAQQNNIPYEEKLEYSSSVPKGSIIKLSVNEGDKIDPRNTNIIVSVSQGQPISVPYFVGKNKGTIQSQCRNAGLNCTFYYVGYNNTARDVATTQNVASGTKVVSGTYVNIGLSSGPAQTFSVYIQGEWFQTSADKTISVFRNKLASLAPGVTFNFVKKSANTGFSGQIHEGSPVKGGTNSFTQGRTYTIWIIE